MTYIKRRLWCHSRESGRQEISEDALLTMSECLVVLGEPGMGKSTLLQRIAEFTASPLCTARQLINRSDPRTIIGDKASIVIDALDEVAAKREGDAVDLVLQKLGALNYL